MAVSDEQENLFWTASPHHLPAGLQHQKQQQSQDKVATPQKAFITGQARECMQPRGDQV